MLYDSIQKIKKLDGKVRVYPGHGAGSSCGKNICSGDFCEIATQMANNYAFKAANK
jgi:hydroxyacylglutathione hydrolase